MKICYIANSVIPSRSANSIHVMKMCQAYATLGHKVTLMVPNWGKGSETADENVYAFYGVQQNFTIRKVPYRHSRFDTFYFGLLLPGVASYTRPDIIHTRGLAAAWGLTSLFRAPTIYELHFLPSHNARQFAMFKKIIKNKNLKALVTITHILANHVRPLIPSSSRLLVAPDGVDSNQLKQVLNSTIARIKLGLDDERRRLAVYTGHLYKGRGIDLIIQLAKLLPDHLFLIVGGQEADVNRYRELTKDLLNIRFIGFKPPALISLYLQAADVLLMPYDQDVYTRAGTNTAAFASPMKMFEYMAAGRPIVASNLPVLQEVLKDGVNALLRSTNELPYWKEALQRLQNEPELAAELGHRAQHEAKQYTWENRAKRLLEQCGFQSTKEI